MKKLNESDVLKFGGKGFSLLKLVKNGFNVPNFFIVNADEFEDFIESNGLKKKIQCLQEKNKFKEIESLILSAQFSKDMQGKIFNNFKKLNTKLVSVRSSGTFEDSDTKSCAGQFKTFLNVKKEELIFYIKKCFASLYSKNLKQYLGKNIDGSIAVVVQKMVQSEFSGVVFSTDFVGQNKNYMVIEATKGLGESLVSGQITPTKYFVRKTANYIELTKGHNLNIDDIILQLAVVAKKIEKLYKTAMDIEWGYFKGKLYILQARPIVAKFSMTATFEYVMSRPRPLFLMQIVQMQNLQGLKWFLDDKYYFKSIHLFTKQHFEEYTNMLEFEQIPNFMLNYLNKYCKNVKNKVNTALKCCQTVEKMVEGKIKFDIKKFIECFVKFGANNTLSNLIEQTTNISKIDVKIDDDLKSLVIKNREYYDNVKYKADEFILNCVIEMLPKRLHKFIEVISLDEIFENKEISEEELKTRFNGFAYYDGQIILKKDLKEFCKKNNFEILIKSQQKLKNNQNYLAGEIAYPGKVVGKAKIVFTEKDLKKVSKGDIIVSSMTVPTYIEAMKKAVAIVTDEGGTVCHAALISRELKKPCVVATRLATVMIHDGDEIIVDANAGKVYFLKDGLNNGKGN